MKKLLVLSLIIVSMTSCSFLKEITALTKCEFSFHSAEKPIVAGIDILNVKSYSDLTLLDGQRVLSNILQKKLPFEITANIEIKNPGPVMAAVTYIEYIAYIDDIEITRGRIDERVEIAPNGGTNLLPVLIQTDLFSYLEGDNPKTMLNFALNLIDAGGQPTRFSLKIKPSVVVAGATIPSPGYFTIKKEFSSGE